MHCDQSSGIDVDSDGNLCTVHKWAGVYRYPASSWPLPWTERRKLVENVLVKSNSPTAASTAGILGITMFKDQLLIAENSRVLIWNKFDVDKIKSGQPADDVYGEKDFATIPFRGVYLSSPLGDPDRALGAGGRLDVPGSATDDPICSRFQVGIGARGTVVAGMNAFAGQRFPLVYLDPRNSTQPQLALGDMTAYPTTCFIDKDGNVYIGDYDWSRVLIYKQPFQNIRY